MRRRSALGFLVLVSALCLAGQTACAELRTGDMASAPSPPPQSPRPATAPGAPQPPRSAAFSANGVKLWYEVHGAKGPTPLIVVNGGPGFDHSYLLSSDVWDRLARHRPVVFYDQRGTGRSEPFSRQRGQTLRDHVDDIEALRVELGVPKIDLAGHSWGGYLSMAYAVHHPQQMAHLVLCDSAAPRYNDTQFLFEAFFPDAMERHARLDALRAGGDGAAGKAALRELLGVLFVSPEKRDEFLRKNEGMSLNHEMNAMLEADIENNDMWPAVRELRVSTLVLTGRFDANVGPETAWKIHKAIPGSRIAFFEQSGHFPFVEEPDRFYEVVEEFLEGS